MDQTAVNEKKSEYKGALVSLERISEEVHNKRKLRMIECNPESDTESDRSSSLGINGNPFHKSTDALIYADTVCFFLDWNIRTQYSSP